MHQLANKHGIWVVTQVNHDKGFAIYLQDVVIVGPPAPVLHFYPYETNGST